MTYGTFYQTKPEPLSSGHPSSSGSCPISNKNGPGGIHEYRPPTLDEDPLKGDSRTVCPALNTMANHGYIPRDGRNLTFMTIYRGLKECYGLSTPLALFLTFGGFLLIRCSPFKLPFGLGDRFTVKYPDGTRHAPGVLDLYHVGKRDGVEHSASLVHLDVKTNEIYPSSKVQHDLVYELIGDIEPRVPEYKPSPAPSSTGNDSDTEEGGKTLAVPSAEPSRPSSRTSDATAVSSSGSSSWDWRRFTSDEYMGTLVSSEDVGKMRVRRQHETKVEIDSVHKELARGEMAIILGVWEREDPETNKKGIPLPYLLNWLADERLPEDWVPTRVQGLLNVAKRSKEIRTVAERIEKEEGESS